MRLIVPLAAVAALAACGTATNTNTTSNTNATANANVVASNEANHNAAQTASTTAPANTTSSGAQTPGEAARINVNELRERLDKGTAVAVDVRGAGQHSAGYIKGGLWIPSDAIAARASELPRDKMIVTYCS